MKINLRVAIVFVLLACLRINAQEQEEMSLNGPWQFALAKTADDASQWETFYSDDFQSDAFNEIPVPSNWATMGYEEPVYRGFKDDQAAEGFYYRLFEVPEGWRGKRVLLRFEGVWSSAEVWLNGNRLGMHGSGFTPFAFDVTNKLDPEGTNRLAVRVRQTSPEYKFDVYDDWTLGGIFRDVTLEAMPGKRWIDNIVAQTTFDSRYEDADLAIRALVSDRHKNTLPGNYLSPGEPYRLRFTLTAKAGGEVARREVQVTPQTSTARETKLALHVPSPHHWTAETPYLYDLLVELVEDGETVQACTQRIGFRQISTEGGVFRINGQAVKLRGVNRHDEHPDVGRATTREQWLQDITLMKAANINYVRLCHYAHAKGFIELCDEMGLYVGAEISLGGAGGLMHTPSASGPGLQRVYETVTRDINHPSIVYWSVGNEDALTDLYLASIKFTKALDPTRPVLMPWRANDWMPDEVDILAPHYWKPDEYDQLAGRSTRPIISTEYTHAYGNDGMGGLEARWKALAKHPAGAGAAIWMWADQGIKTPVRNPRPVEDKFNVDDEYLRIDDAGWDGIVDSYRNFTRDYWEAKAVYAPVYPVEEKAVFTPGQDSLRIQIQNDYDFTDLREIGIGWSVYEDGKELASGQGSITGQPHAASAFLLPINSLGTVRAGKTYYARFVFTRADGEEITCKAVELCPSSLPAEQPVATDKRITVVQGETLSVEAGGTDYVFNPQTGHLASAASHGKLLVTDLRPTLWRPLDPCETSSFGKENLRKAVDLNQYKATVSEWDVQEEGDDVVIRATVGYDIDADNRYTAEYRYTIGTDGRLTVHYRITTAVAVSQVPIVGMVLRFAPELDELHWLGLGPYDAYPNKRDAPVLGVWGGKAGSTDVAGIKETRWIDCGTPDCGFRILHNGYMEPDASAPDTIRILSHVFARPEKGRQDNSLYPTLETNTESPFVGEFSLLPAPMANDDLLKQ